MKQSNKRAEARRIWLEQELAQRAMSVEDVAAMADMRPGQVKLILSGELRATAERFQSLAQALGAEPPADLIQD